MEPLRVNGEVEIGTPCRRCGRRLSLTVFSREGDETRRVYECGSGYCRPLLYVVNQTAAPQRPGYYTRPSKAPRTR